MSIPVVTLGTGTWELVDQIERRHGPITVTRRCLELAELLACAHTGMARAALIAEGAEDLTSSLLEQLALGSVRVLVLAGHDEHRLAALGITIVPSTAAVGDVMALIERVVRSPPPASHLGHSSAEEGPAARWRTAEPPSGVPASQPPAPQRDTGRPDDTSGGPGGTGRVIGVWGPMGAPGRTFVALNAAAELALAGHSVLLVDADTYAASVAASLGMLEETAGLAQACRLADQGRLDGEALQRCACPVSVAGATVDVLTGLTRHDRWPEIRAGALEAVLLHARSRFDAVVVDMAFGLETDEEITLDSVAPRRNAATLSTCAVSDTVVALGAADALGIPRLVKTLTELRDAAPTARVLVAVNKVRRASVGGNAVAAVTEAWERYAPDEPVAATLSWDPETCDEALLAGAVLAEAAPRSQLRREVGELARRALHPEAAVPAPADRAAPATGTRLGGRVGAWLRR